MHDALDRRRRNFGSESINLRYSLVVFLSEGFNNAVKASLGDHPKVDLTRAYPWA